MSKFFSSTEPSGLRLLTGILNTDDAAPQYDAPFINPAILPYFNQCEDAEMNGTFKPTPQNPRGVKQIFVMTVFIHGRV